MAEFCKDLNENFTEPRAPNVVRFFFALISFISRPWKLLDVCGILLHFPCRCYVPDISCFSAQSLLMLWVETVSPKPL